MKQPTSSVFLVLILSISFTVVRCFIPSSTLTLSQSQVGCRTQWKRSVSLHMAAVDEAVALYEKKFPKRGQVKRAPWASWGVPSRDLDGTRYQKSSGSTGGRRLFDVDEKQQRAAFAELAKLYGESNALDMCRVMSDILAFDRKSFAGSLKAFSNIFGHEEAKAMVMRNPGLLLAKPEEAANSDKLTMQLSYVVAATRPAGPLLLATVLGLLLVPLLESVTGIPIRTNLFTAITGSDAAEVARMLQQSSDPMGIFK